MLTPKVAGVVRRRVFRVYLDMALRVTLIMRL